MRPTWATSAIPLTEAMIGEIGTVDVVCVPIGGRLTAGRASELVAQLDANLVVPLAVAEDEAEGERRSRGSSTRWASGRRPRPQARLVVTVSSVPQELTLIMLEQRGRADLLVASLAPGQHHLAAA